MCGCLRTLFRFLLERIQYIDNALEFDRVRGPVGIAVEVFDHLQNACASESPQGFCVRMFLAGLRLKNRKSENRFNLFRHCGKIVSSRGDELYRPLGGWKL